MAFRFEKPYYLIKEDSIKVLHYYLVLVIIINILPEIHRVIKSLPAIYVEDDKELLQPEIELPDDFYSTNYFTDKAIEFIKETPEGKPFFGMITYTAPSLALSSTTR